MRNYTIEYLSYEGALCYTDADGEDEDDARCNAIDQQGNYSGNDIMTIIDVYESC